MQIVSCSRVDPKPAATREDDDAIFTNSISQAEGFSLYFLNHYQKLPKQRRSTDAFIAPHGMPLSVTKHIFLKK